MLGLGEETLSLRLKANRHERGLLHGAIGVSVGCFAGAGYGKSVGMGRYVATDTSWAYTWHFLRGDGGRRDGNFLRQRPILLHDVSPPKIYR